MSLQVQVHIKMPAAPPGVEYTRALLDEIAQRWIDYKPIPKGVKVTAVSWRTAESKPYHKESRTRAIERARASFSQIGFKF